MRTEAVDINPMGEYEVNSRSVPVVPRIKFEPLPKENNGPKYLFRYISLQTFIDMFYQKRLKFTSACEYQDKSECTYPYLRAANKLLDLGKAYQGFSDHYFATSLERGRYFLSCWYGGEDIIPRETMRTSFSRDVSLLSLIGRN